MTFNSNVQVVKMCTWNYAYWDARKGNWFQLACDRDRFEKRIKKIEEKISFVFEEDHREKFFKKLK